MKHRKGVFIFLMIYVICGYTMYLHYLYYLGPPLSLSIFSQADMQLLLSSPDIYNMFILFPLVVGIVFLIREYNNGMQILLYQNKKKILKKQILDCNEWSICLSILGTVITWIYSEMQKKPAMNWGSANSYYCVMTGQILEKGNLGFIVFLNVLVLLVRNFIFILLILDCWWGVKNILYGILAAVGICLIEAGSAKVALILRNINVDYAFWENSSKKIAALVVAATAIGLLLARIRFWIKRKEF